jgi:TOBE domain
VHFGHSAVAGAYHLEDGVEALAYVRPHDVEITAEPGAMSFPVNVERRIDLGWMSKVHLRLEDGQLLLAQLPNEEIEGVRSGKQMYANLRNAKVFPQGEAPPSHDGELAGV